MLTMYGSKQCPNCRACRYNFWQVYLLEQGLTAEEVPVQEACEINGKGC